MASLLEISGISQCGHLRWPPPVATSGLDARLMRHPSGGHHVATSGGHLWPLFSGIPENAVREAAGDVGRHYLKSGRFMHQKGALRAPSGRPLVNF